MVMMMPRKRQTSGIFPAPDLTYAAFVYYGTIYISVLFNGTLTTLTGADHRMILFCVHLRHQRPVQWHADCADRR